MTKRVAITGMAITTPIGDSPEIVYNNMLEGRSAVTRWRTFDTSNIYCKIGADLVDYDVQGGLAKEQARTPDEVFQRTSKLIKRAPWSTSHGILLGLRAMLSSGLFESGFDREKIAAIVAGHNLNAGYTYQNAQYFQEEPDFIDGLMSIHSLDTDEVGSVSEALQIHGPLYTIGGACASGNHGLRAAVDEIRHHDMDMALVVGPPVDFSPVDLHAMALMGAITWKSFNETPEIASRPFDTAREGFIPAHGGAALVIEDLDKAKARGAHIYAEVLGVEACGDGNHLANPNEDSQARLMASLMKKCGIAPEQVGFVSAHATSTQLGDITEANSIARAFGQHASKLKINAPKSMLGHTCWAAPLVETTIALMQMQAGRLHPSVNIDELDPRVQLDVCRNEPVDHEFDICMKNSFGFGGINCVSLLKKVS